MTITKFEIFLKRIQEVTGISSQIELASTLRINRSAITQAKKKDAIPDRWIMQLIRLYDLNPDWIERGTGRPFLAKTGSSESGFVKIPKVRARLSAGGGSFEVGSQIEGYYSFRSDWLTKKGEARNMVLMDIFGNSMEPELKDGDTVLIDGSQNDILSGAVYAVGIEDTILVKRLEKHPSKLVLLSDNKNNSPIYLQNEDVENARIIGKVIWFCREFR